jgi:hypothetical protein
MTIQEYKKLVAENHFNEYPICIVGDGLNYHHF